MTGLRPGQSGETVLTQAGDGVLAMRLNHAESAHAGNRVMRDEHPAVNHDGERSGVDLGAAERAAAEFLAALGIDLDREERRATPSRMARAYAELLAARPFRLTTFPNDVRSGSGSCACRRNQQ